jgi:hypothetical protein
MRLGNMNQRPISQQFDDPAPRFKWSQKGQQTNADASYLDDANASASRTSGAKESSGRRQLELLWERIQRNQRVEKIAGRLRRLGLASIWASIGTFLSSLPHAARTCANVITQQATPFRGGLAAGAVGLLILGIVLLAWAAKRWLL